MNTQKVFPDLSGNYTLATSEEAVLLNGMRVLFDLKVPVYPVELTARMKESSEESSNGNRMGENRRANRTERKQRKR